MRARTIKRALTICLALALSAGAAVAFGATMFICRVDSVARFECCCTAGVHGSRAGGGDTIRGGSCCEILQGRLPVAEAATPPAQVPTPTVIEPVTPSEPSAPLLQSVPWRLGGRPIAVGIPALLQKHSLLL